MELPSKSKRSSLPITIGFGILLSVFSPSTRAEEKETGDPVFWQAHRGGGAHEAPDNTMGAFRYTWDLGGIPEADVRTSKDGIIICLHDHSLARTTTAPDNIRKKNVKELTFDEIRKWDAGSKFSDEFKGERVPSLEEVFAEMKDQPERQVYLDLKDVNLEKLGDLIDRFSVNTRVLVASPSHRDCRSMKEIAEGIRTMLWIGGSPGDIKRKFAGAAESKFAGLDQVQLHLRDAGDQSKFRYQLDADFLSEALRECGDAGIDLEVFPFKFDEASIGQLLDIGIRWYATDEPKRFNGCILDWRRKKGG